MKKRQKVFGRKSITRSLLALAITVCMLTGTSLTVSAEIIRYSPELGGFYCPLDDGGIAVNKWAQDEGGDWFYFGPEGTALVWGLKQPCPILTGPDGTIFSDARTRSVTGQPGQQPLFSIQSTEKDIRYKGLRQMLDSMPLYPDATTNMPELDTLLDQIFAQIITPDMDTHDKLKACYDYLILNTKDSRYEDVGDLDFVYEITPGPDVPVACAEAYGALSTRLGVCDTYSAAFATMAWKLGLPVYIVSGSTSQSGGGYTPHTWCQMDGPDGTVYVFDPHIDYLLTLRGNGTISNVRFGPTQAQAAGKYARIRGLFDQ